MEKRQCLECQIPITGRADKKFCSDSCRNAFNNKMNAEATNLMRNVNSTLGRNRRILKLLNPSGKLKVPRETLLKNGFDFDFYTNSYTTKSGDTYRFCYEQGYLMLGEGQVLLVEKKQD